MSEIVNGKPIDKNTSRKANPKVTKFEWTKHLLGTYRFGEYGIGLVFNGLAGDKVKARHATSVDSYTLKSPLLTPINMNKTYFQVPRMAILPKTWDKIYENPSFGDDIDATRYGTSLKAEYVRVMIEGMIDSIYEKLTTLEAETEKEEPDIENLNEYIALIIRALYIGELVLSEGSLPAAMGCKLSRLFTWKEDKTYDNYLEEILNALFREIGYIKVQNDRTLKEYIVSTGQATEQEGSTRITHINWHQFQEELRDGEYFNILTVYDKRGISITEGTDLADALRYIAELITDGEYEAAIAEYTEPIDLARFWAYQLCCAEFFTNDKVDYIYNAEIFRQYIGNLYIGLPAKIPTYTLNGIINEVDYLSAEIAKNFIEEYITERNYEDYLFALFKYNRSLKYKDYFTGARTRPIAIGNTDVDVNDNVVEVVDIAKGIQKQRFLNIVNKIPRDLKGYTKGIMGVDVAPDWHNPLYLMRATTTIYGQEVENTGEAQLTNPQSRTSVLKDAGGNIQFSFKLDRDSIIIGMIDFDIPRAYTMGVHRSYMEVDRFDYFNPYMQYTGDQEIYGEEIDATQSDKFGYTEAYMEKKQDYNEAFGGFITTLKGWSFTDRYVDGERNNYKEKKVIGPDFIRSKPSELDRFYLSLTGNAMANYFHFIIDGTITIEAVRKMAYKPQILG